MKRNNKRFDIYQMLTFLIIVSIFTLSGAIFIVLLSFGMFGLSRILIFYRLAEFNYNKSMIDNLFYYGSYILFGYFTLIAIEFVLDRFKLKLNDNPYFSGMTFHLMTIALSTVMFYFTVHIYYTQIKIDFWVILVIITILYICTEIFYPDSENLNR
ncbi:SepA family multidrug efflux transporter [Mammaliicoccus stepanovicii]|uniref:Multidrug resistance efflux pump SepA n=1 Tax=Mammaliicoccus stepanovicii TaxID=643214 RepID=A0A239YEY6_9STAP|nr:SepA family multidrug efflux transporter [Mammaliicoccus stepanovicii]PNZ75870.1 multidrug resistance protein SepA [Mammaliicoccus stepanovicii]GGI42793.1 multidrug resistance efflux pump SepA [Mammaliicoccus stepanovicii]SNV57555.1 SmrB [Mammaliicoccus stepanovicii]